MAEMFVDNKVYKKIKWVEISLCLSLLIIGSILVYFESEDEITIQKMLGVIFIMIGMGIAISWIIQSLYFKKVEMSKNEL